LWHADHARGGPPRVRRTQGGPRSPSERNLDVPLRMDGVLPRGTRRLPRPLPSRPGYNASSTTMATGTTLPRAFEQGGGAPAPERRSPRSHALHDWPAQGPVTFGLTPPQPRVACLAIRSCVGCALIIREPWDSLACLGIRFCRTALDHPFDHPDDPSVSVWIRLDRRAIQREQARSVWSRPDRHRASVS
jgi:hypothetical protein